MLAIILGALCLALPASAAEEETATTDAAVEETSTPLREMDANAFLQKKPLFTFSTGIRLLGKKNFANYEGMCLGPKLADGRQTLLLVADSQNRAGNSLYHLKDYIKVIVISNK